MGTTQLVWTAVPRGIGDAGLLLNVHADFHMKTSSPGVDETLADFPVVNSWPPTLNFTVKLEQGAATTTTMVGTAALASRARWQDTFPPTTTVKDYRQRDLRGRKVHTVPASKIAMTLQRVYRDAFPLGIDGLPDVADLRQVPDLAFTTFRNTTRDIDDPVDGKGPGDGKRRFEEAAALLQRHLDENGVVDTSQPSTVDFDFFQMFDYYRPVRDVSAFERPPTTTTFTFQEVIAGFNAEPQLQRVLGLVFELNPIPLVVLTGAGITDGTVDVSVAHSSADPVLSATAAISPKTRSALAVTPRAFRPQAKDPTNGPLADGYLRLDQTSNFVISQCDPTDGIKLSNAAGSMQEEQIQLPDSIQRKQGLPPLRSGLFVTQVAAAKHMRAKIDDAPASPADLASKILYEDDLMRGFVTDIWVKGAWRQDSMRSSTYTFPTTPPIGPIDEEGYVGRGATAPIDDPGALDIGEVIYPWEGTPLGVTVGKVLPVDPRSSSVVDKPADQNANPDIPVQISHGLPLKNKRFTRMIAGQEYRFRMRVRRVDGTSPPFDQAMTHASPPVRYLRTEPISHSILYSARPNVPAEGPNVIVLRGDAGEPPEFGSTDRWAMPSRSTFEQVLRTRVLDIPDPGNPGRTVVDKASFAVFAARDGFIMRTHPAAKDMPGSRGDVYLDDSIAPVDARHLADPCQDAAALWLDANFERPGTFFDEYRFDGGYPALVPLRFRLVPEDALKTPERVGDVINVYVRPGETITGWHAGGVHPDHVENLALLRWAIDDPALSGEDEVKRQLREAVDQGRHSATSPPEPLTFVYAVRRPLRTADLTPKTRIARRRGSTFGELRGEVEFSRRSTDRVDVDIDWVECIDEGRDTDPPSELNMSRASATTVNIDHGLDNDPDRQSLDGLRIDFGDTKHRRLLAGTTATSRYPQHYVQQLQTTIARTNPDPIVLDTGGKGLVTGFTKVTVARRSMAGRPVEEVLKESQPVGGGAASGSRRGQRGSIIVPAEGMTAGHYSVNHATGTITFRNRVQMAADNLYVPADDATFTITYLVPPITQVAGRTFELDLPSSARPSAPEVRYVIPTFGWDGEQSGATTTSTRTGAGLRVYLERPWFSSGCDEQLAVLLWAQNSSIWVDPDLSLNNPISPYVTQWGVDPLFRTEGLPSLYPRPQHFPNRVTDNPQRSYRVDGTPHGSNALVHKVIVAGHDVVYDEEQDCWYADLVINHGFAYTPFIRMALARFQPSSVQDPTSIADLHLSPVVLAEFAQLAPDRFASVTVSGSNARRLTVSLSGPSPEECMDDEVRSIVQVTVEERRSGDFEEELSWTPVTDPIPLSFTGGDDNGIHRGTIILPERGSPQEWRIVFEEFEAHGMEPFTPNSTPGVRGRLVHVDTLVVTAGGSGSGETTVGDGAEGPAPIFQQPVAQPPTFNGEFYEVEFDPSAEFGPGPVTRVIDSSIGQLSITFNNLQQEQQIGGGQPGGEQPGGEQPGGEQPGGPPTGGPPTAGPPGAGPGGGFASGPRQAGSNQYTLAIQVFCDPGILRVPGALAAATSIDITTQNVTFDSVAVEMPVVDALPIRGGLGPRLFHMDDAGRVTDITTEVTNEVIRGLTTSLSSFFVGEVAGVQRLAGAGRVETAAEIANAAFEPGVEAVFLATANNFPDALAAGPLASSIGAPILLVGNSLPDATAAEIDRLQPAEIIILGGPVAVSPEVESQVSGRYPSTPVRRLAGSSRFATAAAISMEGFPEGAPTVYIAVGGGFPDALCGGAAAVKDGAPLLLVNTNSIPDETRAELERLAPQRIVVLGGTAVVSNSVAEQLAEVTGASVQRLSGSDRFGTSAAISSTFPPGTPVFIATAGAFPDALAGTPVAGLLGAAMLLVRSTSIPGVISEELRRLRPESVIILGGTSAVSDSVRTALAAKVLEAGSLGAA